MSESSQQSTWWKRDKAALLLSDPGSFHLYVYVGMIRKHLSMLKKKNAHSFRVLWVIGCFQSACLSCPLVSTMVLRKVTCN